MNNQDKMNPAYAEDVPEPLEFTTCASELFYDTVDHPNFGSEDQTMIFNALVSRVKPIRFGDYLKRYIYRKAGLTGLYTAIPQKVYLDIVCEEFRERGAPHSFVPTKATLRNLAKNWLEQQTVSRMVVLLLGFGLGMPVEDVEAFLTKGLHEAQLNSKDPVEVICWYCYAHQYGFAKYEALWEQFAEQSAAENTLQENTLNMQVEMRRTHTDQQLLTYLSGLRISAGTVRQSVAARSQFDHLYSKACAIVAEVNNKVAVDTARMNAARVEEALARNVRLYDYQKQEMVERERRNYHLVRTEDIGPGDLEQVLFASIPRDKHGNMLPMKASALQSQFSGKRLSRQHITQILAGKEHISRYDLLTLHFVVFAHTLDQYSSVNARYSAFVTSANQVLQGSGMGEYYVTNPYECFLLMCIIAQDPLGTFSDVWEMSYQDTEE